MRCRNPASSRPRLHESMLVFDHRNDNSTAFPSHRGRAVPIRSKAFVDIPALGTSPRRYSIQLRSDLRQRGPHLACWNGTYRGPTRWLGMTKAHKAKEPRATSTRFKASNKRKLTVRAATTSVTTPATTTVIVQEPSKMPFVFWPLDILRWWMPISPRREA